MKKRVKIQNHLAKEVLGSRVVSKALVSDVVQDFEETGLYSKYFLKDLKIGLSKSNCLKNKF